MAYCPNCGEKVSSSDKRCKKCGHDLKKDSSKLLIGIVAVIAVIAIVGIFASGMFSGDTTDATVVDNTNNQESVSEDSNVETEDTTSDTSDKSSSSGGTEYWASAKTDKFHLPTCEWAEKISDSNKIVFHSREEALASGREPCEVCNP